jgi:NADPH:quinone reductase-like Zn-dependent oxidoreductase
LIRDTNYPDGAAVRAAVVTTFAEPPHYQEFADPEPHGEHEAVVEVVAAALSPRVRSQASGAHYTSTDRLPQVPGIDGVGRTPDGRLRYFVLPDTRLGSMAERTVIDLRRSIELPDDVDAVRLAAAMNPAMSSWVALRCRVGFEAGQRVMVLGATGNAGRLAVQVAHRLGAAHVVAVGRDQTRLDDLAAQHAAHTVSLDAEPETVARRLSEAGRDVDVVLDYLWGPPTANALRAIVPARDDDSQTLTWIQIGSVAGLESPIPSAALRATRLQIVGSGQGSVTTPDIVSELATLAAEIHSGRLIVHAAPVPLSDIQRTWTRPPAGPRLVIVP